MSHFLLIAMSSTLKQRAVCAVRGCCAPISFMRTVKHRSKSSSDSSSESCARDAYFCTQDKGKEKKKIPGREEDTSDVLAVLMQ